VIPQFIVTGIAALIFAIFDPQNASDLTHRGAHVPAQTFVTNSTDGQAFPMNATESFKRAARSVAVNLLEIRQEMDDSTEVYEGSNSIVYIFRFGGIAAMIAAVLAWRLARDLRHR
jgi:solute carrier family 45 protein 1/2/4